MGANEITQLFNLSTASLRLPAFAPFFSSSSAYQRLPFPDLKHSVTKIDARVLSYSQGWCPCPKPPGCIQASQSGSECKNHLWHFHFLRRLATLTLSLRSGPVQLDAVPAPTTLAAAFRRVLEVPQSFPFPPLGTTNTFLLSPSVPTDLQQFSSNRTAQAPITLASVLTFS